MKEMTPKEKVFDGIYRSARANAIATIADRHGAAFSVVAKEGDPYAHADGTSDILPMGMEFISLRLDPQEDTTRFWDEVDQIEPPFRPPKPNLEPIQPEHRE